jgi:hypothetical protein
MLCGVLVFKGFDFFGFPVGTLWCTCFQRYLIYLAFLLMLFGVLVSQQESQINQEPLETSTPKSINRKAK